MKISDIKPNPQNPRTIKDDNFKKLVQSIKDFPEMLDARPLVLNKDNVILGGNMRFKASKEAGLKEVPVKIVDWSEEKQREFIIKDNISGGDWDWDQLANEWDVEQLDEWGLDVPKYNEPNDEMLELKTNKVMEIHFDDDASMEQLFEELSERGFECKILTL
jgi:ParB-like chromosome segregation protein Spo0J